MADQNQNDSISRRNPADNLTSEARRKGGKNSAQNQRRDQHGQFAGRKSENAGASQGNQQPDTGSGRTEGG